MDLALQAIEAALKLHTNHLGLWRASAELLLESGRRESAGQSFARALGLLRDNSGAAFTNNATRLRSLALALGRTEDAQRLWLRLKAVPDRAPDTSSHCLDLSLLYNAALHQDWHGTAWPGNNLAALPPGRQTFGGVEFDVRGIIQLASPAIEKAAPGFPETVRGIGLRRTGRRVHFLHAAGWGSYVPVGTHIGDYVVHYADGQQAELPLVTGENTASWHAPADGTVSLPQATTVWTGTNAWKASARLLRWTWENPRPEVEIAGLDFVSTMTHAAPFLVAITVEP